MHNLLVHQLKIMTIFFSAKFMPDNGFPSTNVPLRFFSLAAVAAAVGALSLICEKDLCEDARF